MKRSFRGWVSLALVCAMSVSALAVSARPPRSRNGIRHLSGFQEPVGGQLPELVKAQPTGPSGRSTQGAGPCIIEKRERPVVTSSWRMCPSI